MSHFLNERAALVTEAIDAEINLSNGQLQRLEGAPAIKVVVRSSAIDDRSKVAVVSGGGAGHEPAHVGFVGDGMLSAAVCGEIFASPSVDAVLAGIFAVTGAAGCLLVVKNYTGDRLNFGLAAEKARALGLDVQMVIVGDDVAILDAPRPRGIAGTLFVHKVAGHLARSGASLASVKSAAERVAAEVVSIGLSLSSCAIPGQPSGNRIGENEAELGLGIHGEPGAKLIPLAPVRELTTTMMNVLEAALAKRGRHGAPIALLLNNLGGVPAMEMAIAGQAAIDAATAAGHDVRLVIGPAPLMTSLDMNGFSISALPLLDAEIEAALIADVEPRAWPPCVAPKSAAAIALPSLLAATTYVASEHAAHRRALERICQVLIDTQAELDELDAQIGDGDTGTTLATAARAILSHLDPLPFADRSPLFAALSDRLSRVMGGSSGILLAIFTAAVGASFRRSSSSWSVALDAGVRRVQEYGGAKVGDRTLLDALVPAIAALGTTNDLRAAAVAAKEGAARTASMTNAAAGRASYVRAEALCGVRDPGAAAVAFVFAALAVD